MSHLVIVDGHAIAHRAYHSIPKLTSNGQSVNAIYGFYSMLLSAIDIFKPKYMTVCLDSPGPNFRNEEFIGYRAKRKPADSDLISQLPLIKESLNESGILNYAISGFEGDDLIATITTRALKKISKKTKKKLITKVTIITGDKDLMQLVDTKTSLFMPIRGLSETKTFLPEDVKEKLGVLPTQVIDLKALMGDASDNYPGVAGIGPKAANDLLTEFKNLDNIYSNLEKIKPSLRQKLEKDKDNAYLSKKLSTLISDIPLNFSLKKSILSPDTDQKMMELFKKYNFRSLVSRVEKNTPQISKKVKKDINQTSLF